MDKPLLIIGYVWPEPKSSAAGSRMLQLIEAFLHYGYKITFASPCAKTQNAFNLGVLNVSQETIVLNDSGFDSFISNLDPQIVIFDRFLMEEQFGWRVAEQCPNAIRILDTEDLHFLRKARQNAFKKGNTMPKALPKTDVLNDTAKREIASIYRCDLSLVISKAEMEILKTLFGVPNNLLMYLPFMLHEEDFELPKFENRQHFITIGNFLHDPNYNAVLYLKETLWPLIRAHVPSSQLYVYGAYCSDKVKQLHNEKQGFLIKGFIDDVNVVMQNAKVCLAPLRFGAGLKGKLVDALKNGTPVVTTTIGAEGMEPPVLASGYIEDDPVRFVEKAIKLYTNTQDWNIKHKHATKHLYAYFNRQTHRELLFKRVNALISDVQRVRANNFIGQMLMHHTQQSTKYLSKWIEAKQIAG